MRTFGDEISGNRRRGCQFSPEAKGAMLGMLHAGASAGAVAREFRTTHSTVLKLRDRFKNDNTVKYKERQGRPSMLTKTEKRYIIRMASKDRSITWAALVGSVDTRVSKSTVRRVVRTHYKRKWKAMDRVELTPESARIRLQWARYWLPRIEDLMEIICSDETTIQNASSNPNVYLFRRSSEKYRKDLVNRKDHVKPSISLMYWGGIWKTGRTPLVLMHRDENAPRRGYSSISYQLALEEGLLPLYDGTRRFQQDNAKIHVSNSSMTWLMEHAIELLDWPPHSPDISPIENLWSLLKARIRSRYPYLNSLLKTDANIEELKRCAQVVWRDIDQSLIRGLMESLPNRLRAVIRARGWYTKY
ncbi:unnamed protein product [Clonostachys rosea f. rosea IK726]|uniref:Uncharacterized protein n=1 Tax=Clonostachys rosea f. rosea IK726 TaxID=1349383 RepID=A0ACA9UPS5_BIOOC|nr:unnamed protein product [Clonostachys rosea f. rosea IK726]